MCSFLRPYPFCTFWNLKSLARPNSGLVCSFAGFWLFFHLPSVFFGLPLSQSSLSGSLFQLHVRRPVGSVVREAFCSFRCVASCQIVVWGCEPFFPLQRSKTPRTPNLSKICPDDCFSGFQSGGTQICQKFVENLKNDNFRTNFQIFDKYLTNLGPPDWNPEKQSSGQILDKFGVRGVLERCKGKKGSQVWGGPWTLDSYFEVRCQAVSVI